MTSAFTLREQDAVRVDPESLRESVDALFQKAGVPPRDAAVAADVLISADLRGVDSHGVSNMLKIYLDRYADGTQNPNPNWRIVRERPASANIDCDRGLGVILAPKAMQIAIDKARHAGVGVVTLFNSGHLGMAAYHAMIPLSHDMIGICMTAAGPAVLPTFGRIPRLGTNPIAIAAPTQNERPWVLDMATSVVPVNKVRNARRMGNPIPPGLIADSNGTPITEPTLPPDNFHLLPLGTTPDAGSHKGYGLAVAVDILSSVLAGADFGIRAGRLTFRHYLAAYNIDAFSDVNEFKTRMDDFIAQLKATPPAEGRDRVLVAGQPEWEALDDRSANGVPLHPNVVQWLRGVCAELRAPCNF